MCFGFIISISSKGFGVFKKVCKFLKLCLDCDFVIGFNLSFDNYGVVCSSNFILFLGIMVFNYFNF